MTLHLEARPSQSVPAPAQVLGFAGLIPFAGCALAVAFLPEIKPEAADALLNYGAVILSFLGGIRWGFAVFEGDRAGWIAYGVSVIPSLVAWVAAARRRACWTYHPRPRACTLVQRRAQRRPRFPCPAGICAFAAFSPQLPRYRCFSRP